MASPRSPKTGVPRPWSGGDRLEEVAPPGRTEGGAGAREPHGELEERLRERRGRAERQAAVDHAFSWLRGGIVLTLLVLWWLSLGSEGIAAGWLLVPIVLFLLAVLVHDGVVRGRERAERAVAFYASGLARMEDRWVGTGETGERFSSDAHPYARDLDLFGHGSMFELLCTARTRAGQQTLAEWLRWAAPSGEVRARQEAVRELRANLDLREDLALAGEDVREGVAADALRGWAEAPPVAFPRFGRAVSAALASLDVLGALLWWLGAGPKPLIVALALAGTWSLLLHARVERTVKTANRPGRDLALLGALLARLERERFGAPRLVALRERLDTEDLPPSRQVRRLARLQELLDSRRNQLFAPIALPLLWTTQLALAVEHWRLRVGPRVPAWLSVAGEVEALCALAGYAYEHPADRFPELVEKGPLFAARGLGHPLIPEHVSVGNDVRLDHEQSLLLVSGSNMSGKSTLLRSVGVNAVLALAGAPVRARALRISPLSIGASVRIVDSLQRGSSRFYTEITRLRQIADLARDRPPVLFLLDEILHGTNSGDRLVGAEAVVRELLERGGIGLVTTHDLALARIADNLAPRTRNVHFEDHLEGGRIAFDYLLRDGVVSEGNALALMRAVGLEV
jgi:hypothetical protein